MLRERKIRQLNIKHPQGVTTGRQGQQSSGCAPGNLGAQDGFRAEPLLNENQEPLRRFKSGTLNLVLRTSNPCQGGELCGQLCSDREGEAPSCAPPARLQTHTLRAATAGFTVSRRRAKDARPFPTRAQLSPLAPHACGSILNHSLPFSLCRSIVSGLRLEQHWHKS